MTTSVPSFDPENMIPNNLPIAPATARLILYCSQADLMARFGERLLRQRSDPDQTGDIQSPIITKAISDACDLIDSYLAGRYQTPITAPVPMVLAHIAADIAWYELFASNPDGNEAATTRYKQAVDWLKMVHSRKLALSLPMVAEAAAPIGTAPHFTPGQPHKFSMNRTKI